jgi:hypothetical protein
MALPQVADTGTNSCTEVATYVLNNRSRTADKGGRPGCVLGEVLILPKLKTYYVAHCSKMCPTDHLLRSEFRSVSPVTILPSILQTHSFIRLCTHSSITDTSQS